MTVKTCRSSTRASDTLPEDARGHLAFTMSTSEPDATERSIPPLPAIDTSPESWRFVASAFVVECLLWGQVFSSGIFLKYLATRPVSHPSLTGGEKAEASPCHLIAIF